LPKIELIASFDEIFYGVRASHILSVFTL